MMGCYDFCGHYDWTFAWLERTGGQELLREYWNDAIAIDSQRHARELIGREGFIGMAKYWQHTLSEESPDQGFHIARYADRFRIDIHDCPSKGFLIRNGLEQHRDYCDHCIGWIGPVMRAAGFVVDHEHNHRGQCWWQFRASDTPLPGATEEVDVRQSPRWAPPGTCRDQFIGATSPAEKQS